MRCFARKKAVFILEDAGIEHLILVEFQAFEFDSSKNQEPGIGCKVLKVDDAPVIFEQPYQMKITKWPRTQVLSEEQKSQFILIALVDALLKAGFTGGCLMRMPFIDIKI